MLTSPHEVAASSTSNRFRSLGRILAAVTVAASLLPNVADAKAAGSYDGVWNAVFATTRGNCSSGASIPFTITGTRVSSAGGGRVAGSVNRAGGVVVTASVGASHANGRGRLVGNSGSGSWAGIISG